MTTNYLDFSEPRALEKLNSLSNITLKMYDVEAADEGFHTKGYILLVHRGQLARQKKSYEKVFANFLSMGLVGAGYHEYGADYVFATVQTLIEMNTCFNMIRIHLIVLFWNFRFIYYWR